MAASLEQTTQRWASGASAGQTRFVEGVQNTQVDPTQRAIANQAGLLAGFQEAVTSGRWARELGRVGKTGWQSATVAKAGNYSTGISASQDKYQSAMTTWLPRIQSTAAQVKAMPGGTLAQRLERSRVFATTLYNLKRS